MRDQYEKFEVIGRGRHAIVYEGHDHGPLDRAIAVKEISDSQDPRKLKDFLEEASFLANLDHEHLLKVFFVDPTSNMVITELLEGSLDKLIEQQGPMSNDRVRSVMQQSLKALNYLHEKGIIFGALRPSKLMYSYRGKVRLGSFKKIGDGVIPRPEVEKYVAPETLNVSFGEVGPTLDFYCLGFTALELLLGDRFDDIFPVLSDDPGMAKVDWLRWHGSQEEVPPVEKLVPGIAPDLASALDRMLRKTVAERPQSALEVFRLLQDVDPIPVIDGVEQSIQMGSRMTFPADIDSNSAGIGSGEHGESSVDVVVSNQVKTSQYSDLNDQAKIHSPATGEPENATTTGARTDQTTPGRQQIAAKSSGLGALKWALPMFLCLGGIGFGGWWVYENDPWGWLKPAETAGIIAEEEDSPIEVEFKFSPQELKAVSVTDDGKPITENSDGKWLLVAGEHELEFSAGDFCASKLLKIDAENNVFQIELTKVDKSLPASFAKRFTIDPRGASLEISGEKLELQNGFGTRTFKRSEAGKNISVVATAEGYQDYRKEIQLQPEAITHITMSPWLVVEPEGAAVQLAGTAIEKSDENLFPLPRREENYALRISKEGYVTFEDSELSFESLRNREFKIKLSPDYAKLYAVGEQALIDKQFDLAVESFALVLNHDDEKYLKGYFLRGTAHQARAGIESSPASQKQDYQHAIQDFRSFLAKGRSTTTNEEKAAAHLHLGHVYYSVGSIDEAISNLRQSNDIRTADGVKDELANWLTTRSQSHVDVDDLPAAIVDLEEARKLTPEIPAIVSGLANVRFRYGGQLADSKNHGAAKKEFDHAIELVNTKPEYFVARGKCNGSMYNHREGVEDYTKAIEMQTPPDIDWLLGRAGLHRKLDDPKSAISDYLSAIVIAPDDPNPYFMRGKLYRQNLKDFPKAVEDFRMALKNRFAPAIDAELEIAQTFHDWGESEFSKAHFSESISQFTAAAERLRLAQQNFTLDENQTNLVTAKLTETFCRLGDSYNASKDYSAAVAQYTVAINRSGPKDKIALARRANCYKSLGQFEKAETDLRAALKLDSNYGSAKFYWGQLKVKSGDDKARSRINVPPAQKEVLKVQAVEDYRSAIEMLEGLIATKKEVRYYDLIITACSRINTVDTNEAHAALLNKWKVLKQDAFSN